MISMVCQKSNSGKISAHNSDLARLLNDDVDLSSDQLQKHPKTQSLVPFTQIMDASAKTQTKAHQATAPFDPQHLTKDFYSKHPLKKLNFKKVKCMNNLIQQKINESPSDLEYYIRLNEYLAQQKQMIEEIKRDIEKSDVSQLRKKELIYKNWHLHVYEPIKREIQKNMSSPSAKFARSLRDLRYEEYLSHTNQRGCVFRDDFQSEEYDPVNLVPLEASFVRPFKDPTSVRFRKDNDEQKLIFKCLTGKKFTSSQVQRARLPRILNDGETRENIDWNKWILNNHSTINSTARIKSSQKCKFDRNNSEIMFNWEQDFNNDSFITSNSSVYIDHTNKTKN